MNGLWRQQTGIAGAIAFLLTSGYVAQAQQALPPPPAVPNPTPSVSVPDLVPLPQAPPENLDYLQRGGAAPSPTSAPSFPNQPTTGTFPQIPPSPGVAYQVIINGDSPYLLQQVRGVEPGASVQAYRGRQVIQAGVFGDEGSARQRVATLSMQGIGAEVIRTGESLAAPAAVAENPSFFVVVPTIGGNSANVAAQVVQLGVRPEAIQARSVPVGPHLAIGPFMYHGEAASISSQLRRGGIDARVYFGR